MGRPIVAIVGRANVGKSRLFNRLIGRRQAIVEGTPNLTRDRIYGTASWQGNEYVVVDTGGIEPEVSENDIGSKVKFQAKQAISEADIILFVVDIQTGMTPQDKEIAEILRRSQKPIIVVVNKVDNFKQSEEPWEFYSFGFENVIPISAEHGKNIGDLSEEIMKKLPAETEDVVTDEETLNVAIVGKPNVGKSSLVNYLLGKERVLVSSTPGTTRDAVDTLFEYKEKKYNLIDTAGLRRKSRVDWSVEYYSNLRSINAIERADVVLMMIDAQEGVTDQDKKIVGYVHEAGKPVVLAINKWDAIEKDTFTSNEYREEIYYQLKFLNYAPISFISALTGQRVEEVLDLLDYVFDQASMRVKTGLLNEVIQEAVELRQPPSYKNRRLKVFYATQTSVRPPVFIFFVNDPELVHFAYKRYLENALRENFGFIGTPLVLKFKQRS
ncbi:MAG: ribosome biogenesis GTPase Der [Bacillota bacterium]